MKKKVIMTTEIILEEVLDMIPKSVSLTYVDYRDNLDGYLEQMQKCIKENCLDAMYEAIDNAFMDQEWESVDSILKDVRKEIQSKYEIKKSDAKDFIETHEDTLKDVIYERNNSDTIKDLVRNTDKVICFYDTGYEMESDSWSWNEKEVIAERQRIKKILKIRGNDSYNANIEMMIRQASYGGQLVIYFRVDFTDLIDEEAETICFGSPTIAVINTDNGFGDNTNIKRHTFSLPYNSNNVFIDKLIKYNYTYEVCGMSEDWCDDTDVSLSKKVLRKAAPVEDSAINKHLEQEAKYNATFKAGGCTFGDMDINRHRNTPYGNDFPCGNKCVKCSTFWID